MDGGFVLIDEQTPYPYEAPADGYQTHMDISERSDDPNWRMYKTVNFF